MVAQAERKIGLAAWYTAIYTARGFGLAPHHYPIVTGLEDPRISNFLVLAPPGLGKALKHDTPVLTSQGWTTIAALRPGDQVMHPSGYFIRVLAISATPIAPLWQLTFADGRQIEAHDNHLWRVHHKELGVRRVYQPRSEDGRRVSVRVRDTETLQTWTTLTTRELVEFMTRRKDGLRFFIPLTEPIELPERPVWVGKSVMTGRFDTRQTHLPGFDPDVHLAMPPYLLGCILGDGHIQDRGQTTITSADVEMEKLMSVDAESAGMWIVSSVVTPEHCSVWRVKDAAARIRVLGLEGTRSATKFIPDVYFNTSVAQRLALLQGLFDTDGYVNAGGSPDFTSISYALATGVQRLVRSLGGEAKITVLQKHFTYKGVRKSGQPAYRVAIRVRDPRQFFRLTRKKNIAFVSQYAETLKLRITDIRRTSPAESICIQVEAEDGLFLAGDYIVTHNSSLLSSVYPAWELGHDPTLTILGVSAGERLPQGFMAATAQIIQHDRAWKELFPQVRPSVELGWSRQNGLYVTGHHPSDPDASFVSIGLSSMALTGLHARLHIYDDLHDRNNSATPDGRAQVIRTYYDTLMGRADPRGCRRVAAGRWWAEDDLYQEWIKSGDWVVLQLPAARPGQTRLWYDVYVPKGLQCIFTETLPRNPVQDEASLYVRYRAYYSAIDVTGNGFYWPASPSKRKEYEAVKRRQPRIAAINYDGDMMGATEAVFQDSDFIPYVPPENLATGISDPQVYQWVKAMTGDVEQAWDTALGQPLSQSWTVSLTGLLVPCSSWHCGEDDSLIGVCDFHYDVYLLDAMVCNVDFRQLAMALRSEYAKWAPIMVTVEEKQSGVGLLQTFKGSHIPIRGQKVDHGKLERAVNPVLQAGLPVPGGAASVQGWGRMGRIRYPIGARWITHGPKGDKEHGFLRSVLSFKGGTYGTDEFDALIHLVTRAIVRSHRHGRIGVQAPTDMEAIDFANRLQLQPKFAGLSAINQLFDNRHNPALNPFVGFCGACRMDEIVDNREWCVLHGRATTAFGSCSYWKDKSA